MNALMKVKKKNSLKRCVCILLQLQTQLTNFICQIGLLHGARQPSIMMDIGASVPAAVLG